MKQGVLLTVAYDGTDFCGWQSQPGLRTVQGELSRAAAAVLKVPQVQVRGVSRTDSGVHAECQRVALDGPDTMPVNAWVPALNPLLPNDIVVRKAEPVEAGFTPRHHAQWKRYRYLCWLHQDPNPLLRHVTWHVGQSMWPWSDGVRAPSMRIGAMEEAGRRLCGTHDFRSFCASDDGRDNTVRTLHAVVVTPHYRGMESMLAIEVTGTAFLKQMVRVIAGTLIAVGGGRMDLATVTQLRDRVLDRHRAGVTAPAKGLTLVHVEMDPLGPSAKRFDRS